MTDLSCKYLGLQLKNPIVVGSSGLTSSIENLKTISSPGADAVQMVSALYKNHFEVLPQIIKGLGIWMEQHKYSSISEFKGLMSKKNVQNPAAYKRVQFLRLFSSLG